MDYIVLIVTGIIGSLGFGLIMNLKKTRLFYIMTGSALTCLFYVICQSAFESNFVINLIPTLITAAYCEILARIVKAPVTTFLFPSLIALVPGGALYYTMHYILNGDSAQASLYGMQTVQTALALAVGIVAASVVAAYIFSMINTWRIRK